MRNILKQIKQIFVDNKEYFIRCTIMTLIAGLILGISIATVVPVSAEASTSTITAGTYTFNSTLTPIDYVYAEITFTVSNSFFIDDSSGTPTVVTSDTQFDGDDIAFGSLPDGTFALEYNGSVGSTLYNARVYDSVNQWECLPYTLVNYGVNNAEVLDGWGRTITITSDTEVEDTFATWFYANTTNGGNVDPEPEYTISAGWYLWQEELLGEFIPHTLTFNYRTFQRVGASGVPYYSYWSSMQFDNHVENDSYFSRLYYSSISNGRVLVYDDINGGWVDETYRRFYISSPLTLSAADYFIFNAYTEYYGDTPPSFSGETVPSVPDPDSNIFTNIIGGVLEALDAFTIIGGFSLLDLITTLLGGMALIWILKLLAGG